MISYKWSIDKITVAEGGLVAKVDWRVTATDGDLKASAVGYKNLVQGDVFTPYAQLTEQQVLDWCFSPEVTTWTNIDGVEQSAISLIKDEAEAQVSDQIARQLAQKIAEPALPWQA
jgi:hypothetical protein